VAGVTSLGLSQQADLHAKAAEWMPGGVSSPVRALVAVGGSPLAVGRGEGAYLVDTQGKTYVDLQMGFGPLLVGHAEPSVVAAVQDAASHGLHFGALHPDEVRLAGEVVDRHPAVARLRFVTSGTEAVMSAVRLARAATGRDLIVKFEGGYHGHADCLLTKAGSGLRTFGLPASAGVTPAVAAATATLPLGDEAALEEFFALHGPKVAAAIVEGVPANDGLRPQAASWHAALRRLTRAHGALLIVDEVITGFRMARGGETGRSGLEPDIVTLGKILGGGLPAAAYGGRKELMALVAPEGPVYQAGTLAGNPLAMTAGLATLHAFDRFGGGYQRMRERTRALRDGLEDEAARLSWQFHAVCQESLLWLVCADGPASLSPTAVSRFSALHRAMRAEGVFLPPSAYEVAFLSSAHDDNVVAEVCAAFGRAVRRLR
jgi:glutamate-1-semialdehyde 2,1-aminomutase